jgi:YHS domain-containing protein
MNIGRVARAIVTAGVVLAAANADALDPVNKSLFGGVAIKGYDPVAYFTDGVPVEGKKEFEYRWMNAVWRFASAAHRDAFKAMPERYAPAYGGYCAWAVAQGDTASIDPAAWKIVDGRLYLNYSKKVQQTWAEDIAGNITKADANWPKLLAK